MAIDKKELSRLSPEERIKRLKLMEESRKKEVDEIETLIRESMHEMKIGKIAGEVAPEQKAVDISKLFQQSGGEKLERTARKESKSEGSKGASGYHPIAQAYKDYSQLKTFYGIISTGGDLTRDQIEAIGKIGERINIVEKYTTEGEKAVNILSDVLKCFIVYHIERHTRRHCGLAVVNKTYNAITAFIG